MTGPGMNCRTWCVEVLLCHFALIISLLKAVAEDASKPAWDNFFDDGFREQLCILKRRWRPINFCTENVLRAMVPELSCSPVAMGWHCVVSKRPVKLGRDLL